MRWSFELSLVFEMCWFPACHILWHVAMLFNVGFAYLGSPKRWLATHVGFIDFDSSLHIRAGEYTLRVARTLQII